jgi:GT2 family glycosyltransferase
LVKYSVIIPSFNNKKLTQKCLEAVRQNSDGDYEVIVIDNHSTDGSLEYLKVQKDITLFENHKNLGFSRANNIGAEKSTGEVLIFLNNDTEVQPGWLGAVDHVFKKEKNVGAVGVKLLFPDGRIQHAGVVIAPDHLPRHIYRLKPGNFPAANMPRDYKVLTAACLAIPKKIYEEMSGFDESFKNGLEDVDLCLKIYHKGYRLIYTPKAVVIHHESVAPGRFKKNDENADLYMSRWKDEPSDSHKYYKEDGMNWLQIALDDLKEMSWGPDKYKTRPAWISVARYIYIPIQKIVMFFSLVFKGDFRLLGSKIKKVFTHEG